MSVQPVDALRPPTLPAVVSPAWRVGTVVACHALVDFISFMVIPLMTVLKGRVGMSASEAALLLAIGSIASGGIQPIAAWLSDRFHTRSPTWIGLAMAGLAIGSVGYAQNLWQLALLQLLGTAGIGAFHPPGAAAVGHLAGVRRSAALSIFFAAGMLGGVTGNNVAPHWVRWFGVESLIWLVVPAGLGAVVLWRVIGPVAHRHDDAHANHSALPKADRDQRWFAVGVLYAGNVLRFTVNMMLVQLIVAWTETRALARAGAVELDEAIRLQAAALNGPLQGAMQIGMGAGGLVTGFILRPRHEKTALVVTPIAGAIAVACFPLATRADAAFLLGIASGVGFGAMIPVTMSMGQRLLPHRTSLASGLMLGGAWLLAGAGPPLAQLMIDHVGLVRAFIGAACILTLAGLISAGVPGRLVRSTM